MRPVWLLAIVPVLLLLSTTSPARAADVRGYPCWVDHTIAADGTETLTVEIRSESSCGGNIVGYGAILHKAGAALGNGYWPRDTFFHLLKQLTENSWRRVLLQTLSGNLRVYRIQYLFS